MSLVQAARPIDNDAEHGWQNEIHGQLGSNLGKEVGAGIVHTVVDFSQEHRSFVREHKNETLDSEEGIGNEDEEKTSVSGSCSICCAINSVEGATDNARHDDGNCEFHIRSLGKSESIEDISAVEKTELKSPRGRGQVRNHIDSSKVLVKLFTV